MLLGMGQNGKFQCIMLIDLLINIHVQIFHMEKLLAHGEMLSPIRKSTVQNRILERRHPARQLPASPQPCDSVTQSASTYGAPEVLSDPSSCLTCRDERGRQAEQTGEKQTRLGSRHPPLRQGSTKHGEEEQSCTGGHCLPDHVLLGALSWGVTFGQRTERSEKGEHGTPGRERVSRELPGRQAQHVGETATGPARPGEDTGLRQPKPGLDRAGVWVLVSLLG